MEAPSAQLLMVYLFLLLSISSPIFIQTSLADAVTPDEAKQLRDEIDSLDTLGLLGDWEQFAASVEWIGKNLQFGINKTVSVFETSVRVLGGLLSAHLIASDHTTGMKIASYENQLLDLARIWLEDYCLHLTLLQHGQKRYPLRPELIESTYWLYKATRNPRYVFSTEGHLLPATPQISLVSEPCSYLGAFCKSKMESESCVINNATDVDEAKRSFSEGTTTKEIPPSSDFSELISTTGL